MDYQVLITDTALADLREIVEFIAPDDAGAAARFGLLTARSRMPPRKR